MLYRDKSFWVQGLLLALLSFGFIVSNAPFLLLLSVPRALAATAQAIGRIGL